MKNLNKTLIYGIDKNICISILRVLVMKANTRKVSFSLMFGKVKTMLNTIRTTHCKNNRKSLLNYGFVTFSSLVLTILLSCGNARAECVPSDIVSCLSDADKAVADNTNTGDDEVSNSGFTQDVDWELVRVIIREHKKLMNDSDVDDDFEAKDDTLSENNEVTLAENSFNEDTTAQENTDTVENNTDKVENNAIIIAANISDTPVIAVDTNSFTPEKVSLITPAATVQVDASNIKIANNIDKVSDTQNNSVIITAQNLGAFILKGIMNKVTGAEMVGIRTADNSPNAGSVLILTNIAINNLVTAVRDKLSTQSLTGEESIVADITALGITNDTTQAEIMAVDAFTVAESFTDNKDVYIIQTTDTAALTDDDTITAYIISENNIENIGDIFGSNEDTLTGNGNTDDVIDNSSTLYNVSSAPAPPGKPPTA